MDGGAWSATVQGVPKSRTPMGDFSSLAWWPDPKEFARNAGDPSSYPWVGKTSWRREWQPTTGILPGEFHGQRSLADHSPWGHKELDMTE